MSMISEQVKELREKAQVFEDSGCATNGIVKTFREAADTIEELSAKLAINSQPPAYVPDTNDGEWIPCGEAVGIGYLYDWYIASVTDAEPVWTEAHLEELCNDFIIIPKPEPYKGVE